MPNHLATVAVTPGIHRTSFSHQGASTTSSCSPPRPLRRSASSTGVKTGLPARAATLAWRQWGGAHGGEGGRYLARADEDRGLPDAPNGPRADILDHHQLVDGQE